MIKVIASLILASAAFTTPAFGQSTSGPAQENEWTGELEFGISPRIGQQLPNGTADDIIDESEGELSLAITRVQRNGIPQIQFKFGLTVSPQAFDESDPESTAYAQATVGDTFIPYRRLRRMGSSEFADNVSDAPRPYVRYRYTSAYSNTFDTQARYEHQLTGGIRYRDVRTIMAERANLPAASEGGAASDVRGVYWEGAAELSRTWSNDADYDRTIATLRLSVFSRPYLGGIRLFGKAQGDLMFYSDAFAPSGNKREDRRFRLSAGLDLTDWVKEKLGADVGVELGGQYQHRSSNDPTRRHDRGYFIPSFSITTSF